MDWNFYQPPLEDDGARHSGFQHEPQRPVIALMGTTGVGKTLFASRAVGQDLETEAPFNSIPAIQEHEFRDRTLDMDILLVDTPSFDDPNKSDHVLLGEFFEYVQNLANRGLSLWGIIYFHRINDTRMYGSAQRTLQLLTTMLGTQHLRNVRLCTTMWDKVDNALGDSREKQLKKKFWAELIQKGAQVEQFNGSPRSAWSIVEQLVQSVLFPDNLNDSQVDQPTDRRPLSETDEGRLALKSFDDALEVLQESLQTIQNQLRDPDSHNFGFQPDPMEERVLEGQIRIVQGLKDTFLNAGAHRNHSSEADMFSRLSLAPSADPPHPSSSDYNNPHSQRDDSESQPPGYSPFSTVSDPRTSCDNPFSPQQNSRQYGRQRPSYNINPLSTEQPTNLDLSRRRQRQPKSQRYASQESEEYSEAKAFNLSSEHLGGTDHEFGRSRQR